MLGDINDEFVETLKQLRERRVRFGFISDQRGMDAGSHGKSEFVALTRLLDELLSVRGALPDFWIASGELPQRRGTEFQYRNDQGQAPSIDLILRAMKWYGADKDKAVFVGRSEPAIVAANDADIESIKYAGRRSDRTCPSGVEAEIHGCVFPCEISDIRELGAAIEQRLRLGRRRTA
ncbi:hypothetical protein [Rhizobium ruizarguesonis]|uniref:hypothetical protein n=1 Tax=Rhizobium ruizarguesonis TaxID=2081791 RepID=UPI0013BFD791|nr:hypothetical protein [Rhizobium ruizarguesonis]NEJ03493.1 hypothetical protein [Rhizobium ruizarguesonis]NEJ40148.1 hypothetical protein [Rhizobium ruizarguesonis]